MTPEFIVIGAMKCGTSTLAAQLGAQDGIFVTTPKEPNYFSDDDIFAQGPNWYAALFDAAAPGDLRGEASTHYTKRPDLPKTVERLAATGGTPKLVYMIRNPVDRAVSHYIHDWSERRVTAPLDQVAETYAPLIDYGLYGWQISPYIETFGADSVLLTSLERLKAEPGEELARVAAHIGYDGPVSWDDGQAKENASAGRIRKPPLYDLLILNPVAASLRRTLVPKALRRWVWNSRKMSKRPDLPDSARRALEARFVEDRALLETYFPGDPSLKLAYPFAP